MSIHKFFPSSEHKGHFMSSLSNKNKHQVISSPGTHVQHYFNDMFICLSVYSSIIVSSLLVQACI